MKRREKNKHLSSWTFGRINILLILVIAVCSFPDLQAALAAGIAPSSTPKSATEIEYEVKAAFIYNFMKFIEWPKQKEIQDEKQNPAKPMVIGILGTNPFSSAFQPILDKEVHGRKIRLVEIPGFEQFSKSAQNKENAPAAYRAEYQKTISTCDVVFICDSEKDHVKELVLLTSGNMILTVSDLPGFVKSDGMIGFVKDDNKIRFEINLVPAQKENIKIRSQLLTLAKTVYETKK